MRYYTGIKFGWRRPRGRGRGTYRMSLKAYQTRLSATGERKVVGGKLARSWQETRRLEAEIALATHGPETYRAIARRLGCSHVHCWRVARRYRARQIPLLPSDEQALLEMRDSFGPAPEPSRRLYGAPSQGTASVALRAPDQASSPYRVVAQAKTLREWRDLERRGGRRVLFSVPVR